MDKTKNAIKIFDRCAHQYQDKFMALDLYDETFDWFCDGIDPENAEILELACGPGNITTYLLTKRPDFKLLGIDLAPKMIELAKINIPKATFEIMDCRKISELDQKYDGMMCGFCLPYLTKAESVKLISDASTLINPGGVIYISTMEDDYSKSGFEGSSFGGSEKLFIHYHQADYLVSALEENGFNIEKLHRQEYPEQDGTFTTDLIILARLKANNDG